VPYAEFGNPQSLNLYAYVENNPSTLGDLDGHVLVGSSAQWVPCSDSPIYGCGSGDELSILRGLAGLNVGMSGLVSTKASQDEPKPITPKEFCAKYPTIIIAWMPTQKQTRLKPNGSGSGQGCRFPQTTDLPGQVCFSSPS
jgi:hypothetical protein